MKHTKGKWEQKEYKVKCKGIDICEINLIGDGTGEGNAKLIAAAPLMIDLLKSMTIQFKAWKKQDKETLGYKWAIKAEEIIKKATI